MPSFFPIVGGKPTILILGSMPSQQSLATQQYYANPRNAFWWLVSQVYHFSDTLDYQSRCEALIQSGVALWDVLYDCTRPGSLDSNIVRESERPNDFRQFFLDHPSIVRIAFNGGAAKQIFFRHQASLLKELSSLEVALLPSSSPAHAAISKQQKLSIWRNHLGGIG